MLHSKAEIRRWALDRRREQPEKDQLSRQILRQLLARTDFMQAATVLLYVDARSEVRTRWALPDLLRMPKRIVVPFCVDGQLGLFHLQSLDQLATGAFGILEPRLSLRADAVISPAEIDLAVVPGVAFSYDGVRLGHGHGYYDRLLSRLRQQVPRVGLAFACQMCDAIPTENHDQRMTLVITELSTYGC